MDGLEDRAEAALESVIEQLYTNCTVKIRHSSRDSVMLRISDALKASRERTIVAKKLVFRSGISVIGLRWLQEALQAGRNNVEELEFHCLPDGETLYRAIRCCRQSGIMRLSLKHYNDTFRRTLLPEIIRSGLMSDQCHYEDDPLPETAVTLEYLEIANYPIGTDGAKILVTPILSNPTLKTLKLIDCDLRSDSATYIAEIIRGSQCLETLDLSYNRHYLSSQITRELTLRTLTQRGLKHNLNLLELRMEQTRSVPMDRSKIDRQLDINRFRKDYLEKRRDPMAIHPSMWCHLLARVSVKPSALHLFLQDSVATLFSR